MQIEYIKDYDEFREEIRRYEEGVRADGLKEGIKEGKKQAEAELLPQIKQHEKALQAEREKTIRLLRQLGFTDIEIAQKTGYELNEIKKVL